MEVWSLKRSRREGLEELSVTSASDSDEVVHEEGISRGNRSISQRLDV